MSHMDARQRMARGIVAAALFAGQLLTNVGPSVAQGPSPEPFGLAGRVEVPGLGFALSFPEDWVWVRYAPDLDALVEGLGTITAPEAAESKRAVLAELEPDFPLLGLPVLVDGGLGDPCLAGALPTGDSLAEMTALQQGSMAAVEDIGPAGVSATDVVLPSGPASRIDAVYRDVEGLPPLVNSTYLIVDGSMVYMLICSAGVFDDDRWLSIAETFEFLPAEE